MYKSSEYAPGDRIRIFTSGSTWGGGGFTTGTVKKVTPSGQLVAEVNGQERRFTARGQEVGHAGSAWRSGPWIEGKAEAEERARGIVRYNAAQKLRREVKADQDALAKLDPIEQQADLIAGLRALADKLAQTGA